MKLVLDTNIYIASLLFEGLCLNLVHKVFDPKKDFVVFISDDILSELNKKILAKKEISSSRSLGWLAFRLNNFTVSVKPAELIKAVSRDPSDNKILECAVEAKADLIITMDKDLLHLKNFRNIGIIHPKTLFYMLD